MVRQWLLRAAPIVAALGLTLTSPSPSDAARASAPSAALLAEVRRAFTLRGKPIPPEIFRDFGDGDLADDKDVWVTVDVDAAVGSNLYADPIRKDGAWVVQAKSERAASEAEETAYRFIGATDNGLLAAIARYSGGGSGVFYTLHILRLDAARAFDSDGKSYARVDLTSLRSVALGDRWLGSASIAKNAIVLVTDRSGPADPGGRTTTRTILAQEP